MFLLAALLSLSLSLSLPLSSSHLLSARFVRYPTTVLHFPIFYPCLLLLFHPFFSPLAGPGWLVLFYDGVFTYLLSCDPALSLLFGYEDPISCSPMMFSCRFVLSVLARYVFRG